MSDIEYGELEPGIYPAQFVSVDDFEYDDKTTGEKEYRWRWNFLMEDGTEQDTLTSRNFRPGTNALKLFTGILGRVPVKGDKPSDHYGKDVQIVYAPNKGGKLTITDVHYVKAATGKPGPQNAPDEAAAVQEDPTAALPF